MIYTNDLEDFMGFPDELTAILKSYLKDLRIGYYM